MSAKQTFYLVNPHDVVFGSASANPLVRVIGSQNKTFVVGTEIKLPVGSLPAFSKITTYPNNWDQQLAEEDKATIEIAGKPYTVQNYWWDIDGPGFHVDLYFNVVPA